MQTLSVVEAKRRFSELLNRVIYRHERIIISRRGQPVAAVVSLDELARLDETAGATTVELPGNVAWLQGRRDFLELLPQLRETHPGLWVAVLDGQVVDSDPQELTLRQRLERAYPGHMVFLSQVKQEEALPPLRLPHVRVVP
jgi:prevent-host-death family protein